jgi:hypothetical protein
VDGSWQLWVWWLAVSLYIFNIGIGLAAQFLRMKFGAFHHALYFAVFVSAILATLIWQHPLLLLTLSALCYMPISQPGTWKHPTAAAVGLIGYLSSCL